MWKEDDTFARVVQFLCGLALIVFIFSDFYVLQSGSWNSDYTTAGIGIGCGAAYLASRCLWYAITGKDNINRDDFD
jgi:hypothetical protein